MDTRRRQKEYYLKNTIANTQIPPKRITRIHAQRKFASSSGPNVPLNEVKDIPEKLPISTESKIKDTGFMPTQPRDNAVIRPKTEDFLTFLCFRGTSVLPPHLECFESPQYTERWVEPKTMTPPEEDKSYKPPVKRDREEIQERRDYFKRNFGPIHVDVAPVTPARVTRSSASLTPTPSFLSSPLSSDCSPNNAAQRKLTRNQLLLKKAMLMKSKKALVKKRNTRILLKKKSESKADNPRVTRSGSTQSQVPNQVPKSPIMACRKTVKASHISKRKKSLCRMLKRIGIMSNSSQSAASRKTRSQSELISPMSLPRRRDSAQHVSQSGELESKLDHLSLMERKARIRKQATPNYHLSPSNTFLEKSELRKSLDIRLIKKRKRSLLSAGSPSKSSELKIKDHEHSPRKRKCLSPNISSPHATAKIERHSAEPNIRGRPARRTKQVAEVYLELVSQKLAKEAEDGLEVSDEEDNISISSIKELKAVAKAKHKLDMKKCVREFAEKHECQRVSPAKTPSPVRSRCSSESTPVKKNLVKRNLFNSDTEDSEAMKNTISQSEPVTKSVRGRSKPITQRAKSAVVEPQTEGGTGIIKAAMGNEVIGRATVRLNRLKSPHRNSTSPRLNKSSPKEDKEKGDCSNSESKCKSPLQPHIKVKLQPKEADESSASADSSKMRSRRKSASPSKGCSSGQNNPAAKISLRKIRSDKEIRRMAKQFLDARSDLPLPRAKKQHAKKVSKNAVAMVNTSQVTPKEKQKTSVSSPLRLKRALSLDEARSSYRKGCKEPLLGGIGICGKPSTSGKSPSNKNLLKPNLNSTCGNTNQPKQCKKPLRRKSLHDNTQLSAVLQKVAKDFESQIDVGANIKMETEHDSGEKSPVKCLNSDENPVQSCPDSVTAAMGPGASLIVPKVPAAKRLNDVVKNLLQKSKTEVQEKSIKKENRDAESCDENKKVSEMKSQSLSSSPAQSSSPLREILPKPVSKLGESTNQHCTPKSPMKNVCIEGKVTIESIRPAAKHNMPEEPVTTKENYLTATTKENFQTVPYIPQVPIPKFNTSLELDASLKPSSNINLTVPQSLPIPFKAHGIVLGGATTLGMPLCQLQPASLNPTLGQMAPGITLSQPILTNLSDVKPTKNETTPTKSSSKQILIAPKPSKNNAGSVSGINSASGLKPYQKIIAPKVVPNNGSHPVPVSHFPSHAPILAAPPMGSLVQTLQHPIQTVQSLPQALHTMQAIPQGMQPIQTLNQSFQTLGGVAPTVQGVMSHNLPINTTHLGTSSSPAKLITPTVLVSSSVPNMVAAPLSFTVGGITTVAPHQVMAQNAIGKVVSKCQTTIPTAATHPLVTLGPRTDGSILSSFVPLNRTGQPQFLTVSMMPMANTALAGSATGLASVTANLLPAVCSQSMASVAPSLPNFNAAVSSSINAMLPINTCNSYSQILTTSTVPASSTSLNEYVATESIITKMSDTPAEQIKQVDSHIADLTTESNTFDPIDRKNVDGIGIESALVNKSNIEVILRQAKLSSIEKLTTLVPGKAVPLAAPPDCQTSKGLYSPIEPSPALSQALSKLYPLLENKDSPATVLSCPSTTSFNSLQINTHIYTSASLISPQPMECGFSRQTAVTKVSQSSPPYLMSTSSSDAHQSKVPAHTSGTKLETKSLAKAEYCGTAKSSAPIVRKLSNNESPSADKINIKAGEKIKSKEPVVPLLSTINKEPAVSLLSIKNKEAVVPLLSTKINEPSVSIHPTKNKEPVVSLHSTKNIDSAASVLSTKNKEPAASLLSTKIKEPVVSLHSTKNKEPAVSLFSTKNKEPAVSLFSTKNKEVTVSLLSTKNKETALPLLSTKNKEKVSLHPTKNKEKVSLHPTKNKEPDVTLLSTKNKESSMPLLSTKIFYSKNKNKSNKNKTPLLDMKENDVRKKSTDINSSLYTKAIKSAVTNQSSTGTDKSDIPTALISKASSSCNKVTLPSGKHSNTNVTEYNKLAYDSDKLSAQRNSDATSKKEPLLKKTLFKHKSMIERKSVEAFSAVNESSVYAFEPDTDSLDISTPFPKRLKKIRSEEVAIDKPVKNSDICDTSEVKASNKLQSSVKKTVTPEMVDESKKTVTPEIVDEPKKTVAPASRFAKLDLSQIEASVKMDLSSSSSIYETEDEDDAPVEIVSIAPVYSNSSAEEELVSELAIKPQKDPLLLAKVVSPKVKNDNSLRCVRLTDSKTEKPSVPIIASSKTNIRSLRNFKINSNLKRRTVARIPMNHSLSSMMGKFPPNSIQSISTANSVLALKAQASVSTESSKLSAGKGTMLSPSKLTSPRSSCKSQSSTLGRISQDKYIEKKSKKYEGSTKADKSGKSTKQPVQSTSVAIQCDLDDSSQDDSKPNESGTQTEGLSKLPIPASASPFYYLPLAMATLGEELPAQLVQQMLAKTQGLVGETEAKMILQQAAQLAQQYHNNIDGEGVPSVETASSAKPISPKSGNLALQKVLKATFSQAGLVGIGKSESGNDRRKDALNESKPVVAKETKGTDNSSDLEKVKNIISPPVHNLKPVAKKELPAEDIKVNREYLKVDEASQSSMETSKEKVAKSNFNPGKKAKLDVIVKRRSGRSSTSASTKATEFDINEAEEIRRNRRARRAAASFAREEGWSSSSEAPLSPTMSPDAMRGWPPARLTSPTPSLSSEGTTSSTPSHRSRMSVPHSRKQSPVVPRYQRNSNLQIPTDAVIGPKPLLLSESNGLTRAPSFFPTEEEFNEPLEYIEKIRPEAEHFGLCRIVPPGSFRPECRVNDDMRFAPCKQYVHRVMNRWGSNTKIMNAIRKCLANQKIELKNNPLIGTLELDLVRLYEVVENLGGLMKVIASDLWFKVSDALKIPRSTQDRTIKLDSIYCKYLLPYAALSEDERRNLLNDVEETHKNADLKKDNHSDDEDDDIDEYGEFVVKGKTTALSAFYRVSKNVASQWQPDPDGLKIDERYWNIVKEGQRHVCVYTASIDTAEHGYGFPSQKNSPSAKHPWNLKNVCQNPSSVLRSMANVIGVSAPTLHVGMMFSTVCWYRDPHSLPWIEYLHSGSPKIWYGVPSSQERSMKEALKQIVPEFVKDSLLWLPSDATMIPPDLLIEKGLKVSRIAQEPGQFVVVFPGAFTSSVCSGYLISESTFYARPQYFSRAAASFKTLRDCCEPAMFSLDRLTLSVAGDSKASLESLQKARCLVDEIVQREKQQRKKLTELGLTASDRMPQSGFYKKKVGRYFDDEEENLCEICKQHLYVSMVSHEEEEIGYCLEHAISQIECHPEQLKFFKLVYTYTLPELTSTLKQMDERISLKGNKKSGCGAGRLAKLGDNTDSYSSTGSSTF